MREITRTILTAVTVASVMALLLPVGAQAAGQLMTIVDADSNAKVQVEDGKLRVGDGNGAMTVDGAVASRLPANPFSHVDANNGGDAHIQLGSGRIAITDVIVSQRNDAGAATWFTLTVWRTGQDRSCTTLAPEHFIRSVLPTTYVPANETLAIDLSTPLVAGVGPLCLVISTPSGAGQVFAYTVNGYRT